MCSDLCMLAERYRRKHFIVRLWWLQFINANLSAIDPHVIDLPEVLDSNFLFLFLVMFSLILQSS